AQFKPPFASPLQLQSKSQPRHSNSRSHSTRGSERTGGIQWRLVCGHSLLLVPERDRGAVVMFTSSSLVWSLIVGLQTVLRRVAYGCYPSLRIADLWTVSCITQMVEQQRLPTLDLYQGEGAA